MRAFSAKKVYTITQVSGIVTWTSIETILCMHTERFRVMVFDPNSPLPRHFQLREAIKKDAARKGLSVGDPIESERELALRYDVSRVTVRRAISDLVNEGFLRKEGRRGTYIASLDTVSVNDVAGKKLVGLMLTYIQDRFAVRLISSITEKCNQLGYNITLSNTQSDPDRTFSQVDRLASEGVAGFIIIPVAHPNYVDVNIELARRIEKIGVPFVFIDCYVEGVNVDSVSCDNYEGGYKITKHLLDGGHNRIAFIDGDRCSSIDDRLAGYKRALKDAGYLPDEELIVSISGGRRMKDVIDPLFENPNPPTAIFSFTDGLIPLINKDLEGRGLRVPKDVALAGFDNRSNEAGQTATLTSVDQPLETEGRTAAKMLIERINGYSGPPRFVSLAPTIIHGASTGCSDITPSPEIDTTDRIPRVFTNADDMSGPVG